MRFWIGLGSNLGDRLAILRRAVVELSKHGTVVQRSRIFACSAVGGPPQPSFLNAAIVFDSEVPPEELLDHLHAIELACGRDRKLETARWGPRTLDLDVLLMGARGEERWKSIRLEVPHARVHERAFALAPLCDSSAELVHPTQGRMLSALLNASDDQGDAVVATGDTL